MRRMTIRLAAVAAAVSLPVLLPAAPASAACVQHGEMEYVSVDVCFIPRPSYLRCDVYVTGTLYDCKAILQSVS